jgi:LemA protein
MQALLLSLTLVTILAYLWYASLLKKRTSAIEALKVIDSRIDMRLTLFTELCQARPSYHPLTDDQQAQLQQLKQLQPQHDWGQPIEASNVTGGSLSVSIAAWQQIDQGLEALLTTVNKDKLSEDKLAEYLQLELDFVHAEDFYRKAVDELNSGVNIFPGAAVAKWARIAPMPIFDQVHD